MPPSPSVNSLSRTAGGRTSVVEFLEFLVPLGGISRLYGQLISIGYNNELVGATEPVDNLYSPP